MVVMAHGDARSAGLWRLVEVQHGVVSRDQLLDFGVSAAAIRHRVTCGRLHPLLRGVYAVGRPGVPERGQWMAAVLAAGPGALLSHGSAASLWGLAPQAPTRTEVTVSPGRSARTPGLRVHRRAPIPSHRTRRLGIPVTTPARTLVDIACRLGQEARERAVADADRLGLIDPEALRAWISECPSMRGIAVLRDSLDRQTYTLTDSRLEQRFLPISRRAGLPPPRTQVRLGRYRVDFYWPQLGLVVETDGLRYHRTADQQTRDRVRDQFHLAAGRTPLRFTHAQVVLEPSQVERTLRAVAGRLAEAPNGLE